MNQREAINASQPTFLDLIVVDDCIDDIDQEIGALKQAGVAAGARQVTDEAAFRAALGERLPDAILADWTLLHFTGRDALAIARERCPGVPFIFVSATASDTVALEAIRHGAIDYIQKNQLRLLAGNVVALHVTQRTNATRWHGKIPAIVRGFARCHGRDNATELEFRRRQHGGAADVRIRQQDGLRGAGAMGHFARTPAGWASLG
ncbi:MAG: response regulator [Betaproteobacteria bacterium]|nr:response regulator [Betaproteobacteria bacterium]